MNRQTASQTHQGKKIMPLLGGGILQRKCACGQHTIAGGACNECGKKQSSLQRASRNSQLATRNPVGVPALDSTTQSSFESRFGYDFSHVGVYAKDQAAPPALRESGLANSGQSQNGRFPANPRLEEFNERPGGGFQDRVHQPMLDEFRRRQGQPPGGIDAQGNQVGPSDAQIKYRPQPIAVLNGPFHAPIDTPTTVGMEIQITVQSSSSNHADMASVQDSEQVSPSLNHIGSFATVPQIISQGSGYMSALNIPNDRHGSSRALVINRADNHGGDGSWDYLQLDSYTHALYGVINPIAIPNSGYRVIRRIITGPGTQIRFRVDKVPEACTVNGFSTTAGPSPAQHDEVIVRA